jgi:hypothetical protein
LFDIDTFVFGQFAKSPVFDSLGQGKTTKPKLNGSQKGKVDVKGKGKADDQGEGSDVDDRLWVDMYEPTTEVRVIPCDHFPLLISSILIYLSICLFMCLTSMQVGRSSSAQEESRRCPTVARRSFRRGTERQIEEV